MCYANSKLLLMMFCGELQRRLRSAGSSIDCLSAHPGISSTDIFRKQDKSKASANVLDLLGNNVLARIQPPERGCHSMLYAATEPSLTGEHYSARHLSHGSFALTGVHIGDVKQLILHVRAVQSLAIGTGFVLSLVLLLSSRIGFTCHVGMLYRSQNTHRCAVITTC